MFDFAKQVLGVTYVLVFILGLSLTALFIGPIVQYNKALGIVLLLIGVVASMYMASGAKTLAEAYSKRKKNQS